MRLKHLVLKNFKRFSHIELKDIPVEAKLVLLIGTNGSGKSSVFDAFEVANRAFKEGRNGGTPYYRKLPTSPFEVELQWHSGEKIGLRDFNPLQEVISLPHHLFYGRTSFRQTPRLTRTAIGQNVSHVEEDADRPHFFIDRDERFENDVDKIISDIVRSVFSAPQKTSEIVDNVTSKINQAFLRVFGPGEEKIAQLVGMAPPADGRPAEINFKKGDRVFHYNLLSAGEKEVFNVLFNLIARAPQFQNTIYFFDELDLHLNATVQSAFLRELTEHWIPENSQLWTASHAIGFIEYAQSASKAAIFDFDNLDFDQPQVLYPQPKDNLEVFEIALPKSILSRILTGKRIVVCENQNDQYYNLLGLPNTVFVGVKDSRDVFINAKREPSYHALRDRDFLSDKEIERINEKYPRYKILKYYDFENYLYHPENVAALELSGFDKSAYVEDIKAQKNERLHYILATLVSSRQNYEEFKTDESLRDKNTDSIVDDFKSDDFERFYKYFDMKVQYKKTVLAPYNLSKHSLVNTSWFRQQIEQLLS